MKCPDPDIIGLRANYLTSHFGQMGAFRLTPMTDDLFDAEAYPAEETTTTVAQFERMDGVCGLR